MRPQDWGSLGKSRLRDGRQWLETSWKSYNVTHPQAGVGRDVQVTDQPCSSGTALRSLPSSVTQRMWPLQGLLLQNYLPVGAPGWSAPRDRGCVLGGACQVD